MKNIPDSFCIFFPISESDPLLFSHFQFKEAPFQSIWETVCEGLFQSPFPGLRDPTQLQSPTDQRQACLCLNTFPSLLPASYVHSAVEAAGVCVCVCVCTHACEHVWMSVPWEAMVWRWQCGSPFCWLLLFSLLIPAVCWLPLCLWHISAGPLGITFVSSSGESALASS